MRTDGLWYYSLENSREQRRKHQRLEKNTYFVQWRRCMISVLKDLKNKCNLTKAIPRSVSNASIKEPLILNNVVCDSLGWTLVGVDGNKYLSDASLPGSLMPEIREILI